VAFFKGEGFLGARILAIKIAAPGRNMATTKKRPMYNQWSSISFSFLKSFIKPWADYI
jgi:hypothetical protein